MVMRSIVCLTKAIETRAINPLFFLRIHLPGGFLLKLFVHQTIPNYKIQIDNNDKEALPTPGSNFRIYGKYHHRRLEG